MAVSQIKINGKIYRLRKNTEGSTKKQLQKLGKYGKDKKLISSYRVLKVGSEYKLYIS